MKQYSRYYLKYTVMLIHSLEEKKTGHWTISQNDWFITTGVALHLIDKTCTKNRTKHVLYQVNTCKI